MLFLCIALISALTLWYILLPLWRPAAALATSPATPIETLPERRDNLLRQMKELEFDYSMGKVDANDYERMRGELASETSDVLSRLEASSAPRGSATRTHNLDVEIELEIQIARARRRLVPSGPTPRADDLWHCTECGRQMAGSDRFCASCGARRPDESKATSSL